MRDDRLPSTRNITAVFRQASPAQIAEASDWYADANRIAVVLAERHDVAVSVAAGIIAALSPMNSWGANVNLAARFLAAGGLTAGYLQVGLRAARRILDGEDPNVVLVGNKTNAFYAGILSAGQTDRVTVDRHAWSLAVNHRYTEGNIPTLKGKRYALAVECYKRAARILSAETGLELSPAMVQSVTWIVWRARYWAEGAWDSHTVEA